MNSKTTGTDSDTGEKVCKWVPCNEVGTCVDADAFIEADRRTRAPRPVRTRAPRAPRPVRTRAPRPVREPRTRAPRPVRTRAPRPTRPVSAPLEGCEENLSDKDCGNGCVWVEGYPDLDYDYVYYDEAA